MKTGQEHISKQIDDSWQIYIGFNSVYFSTTDVENDEFAKKLTVVKFKRKLTAELRFVAILITRCIPYVHSIALYANVSDVSEFRAPTHIFDQSRRPVGDSTRKWPNPLVFH